MAALSSSSCRYIINHVVLPPKLPQSAADDDLAHDGESCLIQLLSTRVQAYLRENVQSPVQVTQSWKSVQTMLKRLDSLISTRPLSINRIIYHFRHLGINGE